MVALALKGMVRLLPPSPRSHFKRPQSVIKCSSSSSTQKFEVSDVLQLAEKARLKLSPEEVEDFRPKFQQIVNWFGQLQEVDLENIPLSLRADGVGQSPLREDVASAFEDRDAMLAAVPEVEGPFIKVPKILNENTE